MHSGSSVFLREVKVRLASRTITGMPAPKPNGTLSILQNVGVFSGFTESEFASLAERMVQKKFGEGELVFGEGEACLGLYVIESGHVRIFKSSAGGREQVLSIDGPGGSIAEIPVFDGGSYPASGQAVTPATLLFISKQEFRALCLQHPEVPLKVLRVVGSRLRRLVGIIEELSFTTVRHRLAAFLLRLAQKKRKRTADGVEVTHEPLIRNEPTSGTIVWSVVSFFLLLAGVGGMVWYFASQPRTVAEELLPESDPLLGLRPTASQRATVKYFFVVAALWVVQVGLGALTAHYGVEGSGFYGIPLDRWLPYSVTRTWHLQIGIFWIATSWLATGLYVAPAVSGVEPKSQRLGVNVLFGALIFVVVCSLAGQWIGIRHKRGNLSF